MRRLTRGLTNVIIGCAMVSVEDREKIVSDWNLGIAYIRMTLNLKLRQWQCLPASPATTKKLAGAILDEFRKVPALRVHHHDLTWHIMAPGSRLRAQMESLPSDGNLLADLPDLQFEVARLAFVPVVERVVEGAQPRAQTHRLSQSHRGLCELRLSCWRDGHLLEPGRVEREVHVCIPTCEKAIALGQSLAFPPAPAVVAIDEPGRHAEDWKGQALQRNHLPAWDDRP